MVMAPHLFVKPTVEEQKRYCLSGDFQPRDRALVVIQERLINWGRNQELRVACGYSPPF